MEYLALAAGSCYARWTAWARGLQKTRVLRWLCQSVRERVGDFVDFLFLSPLERAGSLLQSFTRQLCALISPAPVSSLPSELLSPLSPSTPQPPKRPRQKAKCPHRKPSELSTVSTTPRILTEEDEDCYGFIREILTGLAETAIDSVVQQEESGFITVQKRRKVKAKVGTDTKLAKRKRGKLKKPAKTSAKPEIAANVHTKVVFWPTSRDLLTPSLGAFPPLPLPSAYSLRLHREIVEFQEEAAIALEKSSQMRVLLTEKIKGIARSLLPGAKAELFGSYATMLALPASDLDIVVVHGRIRSRESAQQAVHLLSRALMLQPFTLALDMVDSASIPLIRLTASALYFSSEADPLHVDISFSASMSPGQGQHAGLPAAAFVRDLISITPGLRSLVLTLKQLFLTHSLNSAYTGGLSSYAIFIWCGAFMLHSPTHTDFGDILISFCRFFATRFDPQTTGISLIPPYFYPRAGTDFSPVETLDPVSCHNNVTRTAFRVGEALRLLKAAWADMEQSDPGVLRALFNLRI